MREISTEEVKVGEHIIVDGVEYVAEEPNGRECDLCALHNHHCVLVPCDCDNVIFKKADEVNREPTYRPYKDTDEMIADYKERFNVSNVPAFCMPLIWVEYKDLISLITGIMPKLVNLDGDVNESMENLFENYTYLDGSPCGKVEA